MAKLINGKLVYGYLSSVEVIQANYLADKKDGFGVDDFIAGYTGLFPWNWGTPPCSHTEAGFHIDGELWFFSSTSRKELNGGTGTRWTRGDFLLRNPNRWILQTKVYSDDIIKAQIARANSLIGQEYDFVGVFADFTLPIDLIVEKDSIYCSKAVRYVWTDKHIRVSPRHQFKWAREDNWKIKKG
uniref:Uncharacterized protein n=2 Tax=viral metagenome TaxID=1070528 RepID=A0A6M3Y4C1_9ZZZZ